MPINEGMISVKGAESRLESSGELYACMAPHKGGRVLPCRTDEPALDILCTGHDDGSFYLSIVNRHGDPCSIDMEGYDILSCTEIRTGEYSLKSNDFTVDKNAEMTVSGHSVLFVSLRNH